MGYFVLISCFSKTTYKTRKNMKITVSKKDFYMEEAQYQAMKEWRRKAELNFIRNCQMVFSKNIKNDKE